MDWEAIWLSMRLASATTLFLLFLGLPFAYWLSETRWRLKFVLEAIVALPIILPPTVLGFYILIGHRQLGISRLTESAMGLRDAGDTHDYAAIATPVTWAQVAKAWVRPDPRFAAVSWSRRRGNTWAT